MNRNYLFINNPISGGSKTNFIKLFEPLKNQFHQYKIINTTHGGHAKELANKYKNKYNVIVAVGGDGTINEVASALVNTSTPMGIIPKGSGNGFANHLGISNNTAKALQQLKEGVPKTIDTVILNNKTFVNVAGVGFDGHIAALFNTSKLRGFWSYAKLVLSEFFKYKEFEYSLQSGKEIINDKAFIIAFANSAQYGNHFYIAPKAKLDDGLLNVMIFKKPSVLTAPIIIWKMFKGKTIRNKYCKEIIGNKITLTHKSNAVQLDGEVAVLDSDVLEVKMQAKSLQVIS